MNLHAAPPISIDKRYVMSLILFAFWIIIKTVAFEQLISEEDSQTSSFLYKTTTEANLRTVAVLGLLFQLFALTYLNLTIVIITLLVDFILVVHEAWHFYLACSDDGLGRAYTWDVAGISLLMTVLQALINANYLQVKAGIRDVLKAAGRKMNFEGLANEPTTIETRSYDEGLSDGGTTDGGGSESL